MRSVRSSTSASRSGSASRPLGVAPQIARRLLERHARLVDLLADAAELGIDRAELAELAPDARPSSSAMAPSRA